MVTQNKNCSCARKSGRRNNNAGTDKEEEKKLAGPLAKKELPAEGCSRTGVFNLLSSRANLHLSYNPAGRSHCRQNHHEYIKHHHRDMGDSPGDVPSPTSQVLHLRHRSFSNPSVASSTPQLILHPFHRFTYVTGHSTTLPLLHLRHRDFTYFTWRTAHAQRDEKTVCGGLACYTKLLSLEVATVLDSC